jgi:Domain of unknown function (DUF4512)
LLKYWNPWEKQDKDGNVIKPEFPFECAGGVCPIKKKPTITTADTDIPNTTVEAKDTKKAN